MSKETQIAARKTDQELVQALISLKSQELSILARSLVYLNEVFRRKLDLKMGNDSLYTFAEKVLGHTKDEAYPRIRAAEILRFAPEYEGHLRDGRISMSALKSAQVSFRTEDARRKEDGVAKLSREEKIAILNEMLESSTRQSARVLAERFPSHDKEKDQERVRAISGDRVVVQVTISQQAYDELLQLKEMLAHVNPQSENGVVIERAIHEMFQREVAQRAPKKPRKAHDQATSEATSNSAPPDLAAKSNEPSSERRSLPVVTRRNARRHISIQITREVHAKAERQCMYVSPDGVRCQCRYGTETDHALPLALGGTNDITNLQVLCRSHNGYRAWEMGLQPPPEVGGRFQH